jgi:hypothetical protein
MHGALGFLLILTVHRCYPAGVPRCLQGNFIRRQIRKYYETLCIIWLFALLINLPLFFLTKYENHLINENNNQTNQTEHIVYSTCDTEAREIWSRAYLILLLVFTYLITGIFLVVIYGQVIRIILHSKKYTNRRTRNSCNTTDQFHYLSPNMISQDKFRGSLTSSTNSSNKPLPQNSSSITRMSMIVPMNKPKRLTNSHSTQHLQVIVMLFVVILLYILLLLPYRLLNLLYIVHNQLFQDSFMNEILFQWLLNIVRLLVFLNCALQPIIYLIISSRLRQTVIRFFQTCWEKSLCRCQCSVADEQEQHFKTDNRAIHAYLSQKYQHTTRLVNQPKQTTYRNINFSLPNQNHMIEYQQSVLSRSPLTVTHLVPKTTYTVTFKNTLRR